MAANQKEKKTLRAIKLIKKNNIFFEPQSKNTAAAVLLALLHLKKYSKKPLIISPVDHIIQKEKSFFKALGKALTIAKKNYICTLGIAPKDPTPNFGYIQVQNSNQKGFFSVKRFIEKPSVSLAGKLISRGNCFYNSGIFIASVSVLAEEYQKYYSDYEYFIKNFNRISLSSLYRKIENIPFDKAIMEKSRKVKMVKANFFWKDFGSWSSIYEILSKDKNGNVNKGNCVIYNGKDNLIYSDNQKKKILISGLKDIFFVDTKNYTLITNRSNLHNLKTALTKYQYL